MFTDMVGYTTLTQSNESQALEVLERHNRLLRPFFQKHRGKEVKAIGDSFLVEFDSALDAAICALEIQQFLHDYNLSSKDEWKIRLRIGIHLGDVMHREGDVFGDAVNIASRMEPIAEPEGICLSEQVYDQVRNKIPQPLVKLAASDLKNVQSPIDVYRIVMPWDERNSVESSALSDQRLAVLPFANMSADPRDEFFADGMTEEVISTTSKIQGLSVISRTSAMRYKGSSKSSMEIGRELKARSLLEGSVRKSGNKLRITVQLIDARSDEHLWSETYDRDLKDVFEIQSDIAQRVAQRMQMRLMEDDKTEIAKGPTANPEAFAAYLKGRYQMNRATKESQYKAVEYLERAIRIDPTYASAYATLAECYAYMAGQYIPSKEGFPKARSYAEKAIQLNDSLAEAHVSLGIIGLQYDWDWGRTREELTRALELNPNYSVSYVWYGFYLTLMHRVDEGVRELQRAEELDPLSSIIKLNFGLMLYFARRYDEAIEKLKEARELEERTELVYYIMGLAYLEKSMFDEAIAEFKKGLAIGEFVDLLGGLGLAYGVSGRRREALDSIERLQKLADRAFGASTNAAMIHIGLGEKEKALDLLEKAVADREEWFILTSPSPFYEPIRSSPRFVKLMEQIGLPH